MSDTPLHSVSVAGVTVDEAGRVLLIKRRDNGQWQPSGGVLEIDETFERGVMREVLEETGVHVAINSLTGVYKNVVKGVVALVYRCTPIGGMPTTTDESSEVAWFELTKAISLMVPAFSIRVEDAVRFEGSTTASRVHDGINLL